MAKRACKFTKQDGQQCRAPPLHDGDYCFAHDPEHAQEMAEARRVGGLRRRREGTLASAYDLEGLTGVSGLRRVLEVTLTDLLGMDNSIARARVLIAVVGTGAKLLEAGEFEERLTALEATVGTRGSKGRR